MSKTKNILKRGARTGPALNDIQGILIRGYPSHPFSCHMVFQFQKNRNRPNQKGASALIEAIIDDVQNAEQWVTAPKSMIQIGLTMSGIKTLKPGLLEDRFPPEFRAGPASPGSQASLMDSQGQSKPASWTFGNKAKPVDCVVHVYGQTSSLMGEMVRKVANAAKKNGLTEIKPTTDGKRLYQTQALKPDFIHFDYRDGIDNPDLAENPDLVDGKTPQGALNNFLIGYQSSTAVLAPSPNSTSSAEGKFANNGFYNAFRVLFQDSYAFDTFLDENKKNVPSSVTADKKEWIKAKINGRWSNGTPLILSPDAPSDDPKVQTATDFNYLEDTKGMKCPFSSHTRCTNPRDEKQVVTAPGGDKLVIIRLLRRGVPYGLPPEKPGVKDNVDRGLVGLFFCGGLASQFELMYHWLNSNGSLFSYPESPPEIPGPIDMQYPSPQDALVANIQGNSRAFRIPMADNGATAVNLPLKQFIQTRGTAYCLLPSLSALKSCF